MNNSTKSTHTPNIKWYSTHYSRSFCAIINYLKLLTPSGQKIIAHVMHTKCDGPNDRTERYGSPNDRTEDKASSSAATRKNVFFDTDMQEVKVDTGCSYCMSGSRQDFLPGTLRNPTRKMTVSAYGGAKLQITGIGTLAWNILDDAGSELQLLIQYQNRFT
jgi:hypothetical protein